MKNIVQLGQIAKIYSGGTPSTSIERYWTGTIPWISSADLSDDDVNKINISKFITEEAIKNSATKIIPENSVIVVSRVGVGKIAINKTKVCTSQDFQSLVFNSKEIEPLFLAYQIKQNINKLVGLNQGTSIKGILKNDLEELEIIVPSLLEQKTIAGTLSIWDEAIEKIERLVAAKRRLKINYLQKTNRNNKPNSIIGSFAKLEIREIPKPTEPYIALGIRSHFKGTFQRKVEYPDTVNMDVLYRVKKDDLILNITFAWEGAIALVIGKDENCYVSHRFPTYVIDRQKANPLFIRQLIQSNRMKYDLANISPGGAGRNRVLNKKDFLKVKIWLPEIEIQNKIAIFLANLDREIELLEQLSEKYKKQKRGLMQKLLTGEWRINSKIVENYPK